MNTSNEVAASTKAVPTLGKAARASRRSPSQTGTLNPDGRANALSQTSGEIPMNENLNWIVPLHLT